MVRARYVDRRRRRELVRAQARRASRFEDLGFNEHVLTVDLRPDDMEALDHLPTSCQWCDPRRPHMHTRNGRAHRRFEFSLLPGEVPADFDDEDLVWELLTPFMAPTDGTIVRSAVYEFRSRAREHDALRPRADRRRRREDDAPVHGPGPVRGVRDAANAAWRLDLVLRGLASDELLDGYRPRSAGPRTSSSSTSSSELGRISCQLDPEAAAERDAHAARGRAPASVLLPALARRRRAAPARGRAGGPGDASPPATARAASTTSSGAGSR